MEKPYKNCREFSDENIDNLRACFDTTLWHNLLSDTENIHEQTSVISDYINFCTDLCIPVKKKKVYQNDKPWLTADIYDLLDQKQDAFASGNKKLFHKLKRNIRKAIQTARKDYTRKIQQHLIDEPAKAWSQIKKISGLPREKTTPADKIQHSSDELNKFFSRYEKPEVSLPTPPELSNKQSGKLEITETSVRKLLRTMDARKGPGPDGIIPRVLKVCADQLSTIITSIFNTSLRTQTTPDSWKRAIIKPLPKISKPSQLKDYRPISLTSVLCKTMEKLIKQYVISNTQMDQHQYAYRAKRSCQDALLCLNTTVTHFIDQNPSYYARCLFLDFSSAFDTINTSMLMPKLTHLDINVSNWIASFLSNRTQRTLVNSKLSNPVVKNTGTPQGSVISPTLFTIYTNGITSRAENMTILKYADDTCIIGLISNFSDANMYFSEVARISEQCKSLDLILNPTKTKEMLFSTKKDKPTVDPLFVNDTVIDLCSTTKYLGVLVDENLRFVDHMENITSTAKQRMYIVRLFYNLGSKQLATMMFKSFVLSVLMFCMPVLFPSLYVKDKDKLRSIISSAQRLGLDSIADFDTLISKRMKSTALKLFHDDDHFINSIIERCPSGRCRLFKTRTAWGTDSFYRYMAKTINDCIF